jgi:hypothetical protein
MGNIYVRLLDGLPNKVPGMVVEDENGDYNVYLSSALTKEEMKETLDHEIEHIRKDHFSDQRPITELEEEADQAADKKEEQPTKELPVIYCA